MAREGVRTDAAERVREVVDVEGSDIVGLDDDLAIRLIERDPIRGTDLELVGLGRPTVRERVFADMTGLLCIWQFDDRPTSVRSLSSRESAQDGRWPAGR